jgi:hypothetical protein
VESDQEDDPDSGVYEDEGGSEATNLEDDMMDIEESEQGRFELNKSSNGPPLGK